MKACLEERLFGAACLRDYQLQCVNLTLKTELDALSRELEYERQPLRDKIIAQLVEQKNSLIVTKEHEDSESEITEKTNRKRSLSEANESSPSIVDRKNSNDFDLPDEGSTQPNGIFDYLHYFSSLPFLDILPPEQTVSTGNRRLRGRRAHHVSNTAASNNVTDTGERESSYGGTTGTRLAGNGPYSRRRNQHLIGASGCAVTTTLGEAEIYEDLALILKEGSKRNSRNSGGSASNQHSNAVFGKHGSRQRGTSHHHSYYSDNQVGGKSESLGNGSQGDFKNQLNDNSSQEVYILNEVLHLFGISFKKEDSVTVKTPDLSELTGSVSSVGVRDIWIQIEDGARLRITSKQLRSGRYSLTHLGS